MLEDTGTTADMLGKKFRQPVTKVVEAVTKHDGEPYPEFIDRIITSGRGHIIVKYEDMNDNLSRLPSLEPTEQGRLREKYVRTSGTEPSLRRKRPYPVPEAQAVAT